LFLPFWELGPESESKSESESEIEIRGEGEKITKKKRLIVGELRRTGLLNASFLEMFTALLLLLLLLL